MLQNSKMGNAFFWNAPLNLSLLFNFYNFLGFFPISIDKHGQVNIKRKTKSQIFFILASIICLTGNVATIATYVISWKTSDPTSLIGIGCAFLWAFSCATFLFAVSRKPEDYMKLFNLMKETNGMFSQYRIWSRSDLYILMGVLTLMWVLPLSIMILEIYANIFISTPHDSFTDCVETFLEYYGWSSIAAAMNYFIKPVSAIVMFIIESLPLILSYCLYDMTKGFMKLIQHHKLRLSKNENISNSIPEVLVAYAKLKDISILQNDMFGKVVWTNIGSSIFYCAQTITQFSVGAPDFQPPKLVSILYVLLMTSLAIYLGAESIGQVHIMKELLAEEYVLETLSTNQLTLLLNELSTNTVGIKGGHFFIMNHQFLIKVIGSIITYFIIILQFQQKEDHQN